MSQPAVPPRPGPSGGVSAVVAGVPTECRKADGTEIEDTKLSDRI